MTRTYNFKWTSYIGGVLTLAVGSFFIFKDSDFLSVSPFYIILPMVMPLFSGLRYICRVTLSEADITIKSALPFVKEQHVRLEDIVAYDEVNAVFTHTPAVGKLTLSEGKQIKIRSNGTQNFKDLTRVLSQKYQAQPLKP